MTVRVSVMEPAPAMTLTDAAPFPKLERDPRTGAAFLLMNIATDATVSTDAAAAGLNLRSRMVPADLRAGQPAGQAWRVELPADDRWTGDALEVRFTARTGEAETTVIARVPASALRAVTAPSVALGRANRVSLRD